MSARISSSSSSPNSQYSQPFGPSHKRKIDDISGSPEKSPDSKIASIDAGEQLTPPYSASQGAAHSLFKLKYSLSFSQSLPLEITPEIVPLEVLSPQDEKLIATFNKALEDYGIDKSTLPDHSLRFGDKPLELRFEKYARQGMRPTMEDAHFHLPIPQGYLFGVFDGHGENGEIANMAAEIFQKKLPELLEDFPLEFKQNCKEICALIHKKVPQPLDMRHPGGGTTVLVSYLNSQNRLFTATLGDSKSIVFRKVGDKFYWFPLSRDINWCTPKEEERVKKAFNDQKLFEEWKAIKDPKHRRFPFRMEGAKGDTGINVSRSCGDKLMKYKGQEAISRKPTATEFQILEDDLIVDGCDGVWDFTTPEALIDQVIRHHGYQPGIAKAIVEHLLKTSTDNISVVCAWAKDKDAAPFESSESSTPTQPFDDEVL